MRRKDWVARLRETVALWEFAPFEYGRHDCCLFAARCIDAITGSRKEDELADHYWDEQSAHLFVSECGGMCRAVSGFLGDPVDGRAARRGDVCLVPVEHGYGVGVCLGPTVAVAGENGLVFYPLNKTQKHWRVD